MASPNVAVQVAETIQPAYESVVIMSQPAVLESEKTTKPPVGAAQDAPIEPNAHPSTRAVVTWPEIIEKLAEIDLDDYAPKFKELGFDSMDAFDTSDKGGLEEVADQVGLKPGHKAKFVKKFYEPAPTKSYSPTGKCAFDLVHAPSCTSSSTIVTRRSTAVFCCTRQRCSVARDAREEELCLEKVAHVRTSTGESHCERRQLLRPSAQNGEC